MFFLLLLLALLLLLSVLLLLLLPLPSLLLSLLLLLLLMSAVGSRNSNQTIGNYSCLWEGGGADKAAVDFSCVRFRLSTTVL